MSAHGLLPHVACTPATERHRGTRSGPDRDSADRHVRYHAPDILQLREWAGANNVAVPTRGRIPNSVVEQYKQPGGR
jgi:hypothetical protein